jgi:glucosamine-6-phosphate deaminase
LKIALMNEFNVGQLKVNLFDNRRSLGENAASLAAARIIGLLQKQPIINIVFAAAPSQNEFLEALAIQPNIAWERINAFHMDEYIGLPDNAPQRFGNYLKNQLFDKVPLRAIYYIDGNNDPEEECKRYASLLIDYPTDIVCLGIGENCHIAFNDPHVADFDDPVLVKKVGLDLTSRWQQVHDGCFPTLDDVPEYALTLTIPALFKAPALFCMVPAAHKAEAIHHTLVDSISEQYPSTILRRHSNAMLFIDQDSAGKLTLDAGSTSKESVL